MLKQILNLNTDTPERLNVTPKFYTSELHALRLILLMGCVLYPAYWLIYRFITPLAVDSFGERLLVSSPLLLVWVLSHVSPIIARHLGRWLLICGVCVTAHMFLLLHNNPDYAFYIAGAFVAIFAISASLSTPRHVLIYAIFVLFAAGVLSFFNRDLPRLFLATGLLTGLFITYIAAANRLKLVRQMRNSEKRFRMITDHVPAMIWMSDENGFYNFFNRQWLRFTSLTANDQLGNGWLKQIHPDDLKRFLEKYGNAFRHRRELGIDFRLQHVSGGYRWIYCHGRPRSDENNRFMGYIGSCVDLTERKLKEIALSKSERSYADFLRYAPDSIVALSPLGHVISINPSAEALSGFTNDELVGRHFSTVKLITPESMIIAIKEFKYIAKGITRPPAELEVIRKDKRRIFVEANSRLIEGPDQDKTIQIIFRDVTLRKHKEFELRNKADQYSGIIDVLGIAIAIIDRDGRIALGNPLLEQMAGQKLRDLKQAPFENYLSAQTRENFQSALKKALSKEAVVETRICFAKNEQKALHSSLRRHGPQPGNILLSIYPT